MYCPLVHYNVPMVLIALFCRCVIMMVQETPHFLCWYVHFTYLWQLFIYVYSILLWYLQSSMVCVDWFAFTSTANST